MGYISQLWHSQCLKGAFIEKNWFHFMVSSLSTEHSNYGESYFQVIKVYIFRLHKVLYPRPTLGCDLFLSHTLGKKTGVHQYTVSIVMWGGKVLIGKLRSDLERVVMGREKGREEEVVWKRGRGRT